MVVVVQLVRTPDCGSGGRRFESGLPPKKNPQLMEGFFYKEINILQPDLVLPLTSVLA